jgi:hypothetical protein
VPGHGLPMLSGCSWFCEKKIVEVLTGAEVLGVKVWDYSGHEMFSLVVSAAPSIFESRIRDVALRARN